MCISDLARSFDDKHNILVSSSSIVLQSCFHEERACEFRLCMRIRMFLPVFESATHWVLDQVFCLLRHFFRITVCYIINAHIVQCYKQRVRPIDPFLKNFCCLVLFRNWWHLSVIMLIMLTCQLIMLTCPRGSS